MQPKQIKEIIERLKKDKKAVLILLLGLFGMLLILFSGSNEKKPDYNRTNSNNVTREELQNELEDLLKYISGAGRVKVMITFKDEGERVFANDRDEKLKAEEKTIKNEHIIIDGTEGENGLLIKSIYPEVKGVAVAAEGADNPVIKEEIISVVSALFDINSNNISVVNMKS